MTSSYKFHEGVAEAVPYYARYQYPTQANKAWKSSVKIPPKNGSSFTSAQMATSIDIELPAQGYMNPRNCTLNFDVALNSNDPAATNVRLQNNVASLFERARLSYGSLSLEDIQKYGLLVRMISEATGNSVHQAEDQSAFLEGIGGSCLTSNMYGVSILPAPATQPNPPPTSANSGTVPITGMHMRSSNTRAVHVQCANYQSDSCPPMGVAQTLPASGGVANTNPPSRRYSIPLLFGNFTQDKLIPLKWMASQLKIMLTLADPRDCLVEDRVTANQRSQATYAITNIYFNCELYEYDASYDAAFLEGLRGEGVPIKFVSWNTYMKNADPSTRITINIPERNRSLKTLLTVQTPESSPFYDSHTLLQSSNSTITSTSDGQDRPSGANLATDLHGTAFNSAVKVNTYRGHLQEYQYRIGGKYWPSTPVQCGQAQSNGAAEAYIELAKAFMLLGDYRLHSTITPMRWNMFDPFNPSTGTGSITETLNVLDDWRVARTNDEYNPNVQVGTYGPSAFIVAANLETSAGGEISGLNGEEQNDIALMLTYSKPQDPACNFTTFVAFDALLLLRENNLVELIK